MKMLVRSSMVINVPPVPTINMVIPKVHLSKDFLQKVQYIMRRFIGKPILISRYFVECSYS